jgi:hypothetical protein
MDFSDRRWIGLLGGYRVPYDPRDALRRLEEGKDIEDTWRELWNELYHQGDVGPASYAAVPHLVRIHAMRQAVDWNTYALVATIEEARRDGRNPEIPFDMREAYESAWHDLVNIGLRELQDAEESTLVCSIIGVIAVGKGQFTLGQLAVSLTEDERRELLSKIGWC